MLTNVLTRGDWWKMAVMRPESFAEWSPEAQRQQADFTVRLAEKRDIEPCLRLLPDIGVADEVAWRQTLTRTVRDGEKRALFVAEARGQVVGYGRVVWAEGDPGQPDAAPPGWYLLGLVVDPGWRRRGMGEALTRARMAWVAERADRLRYFTDHGNRASQALHERLGFTKLAESWIPPGGTEEDARTQKFYEARLDQCA